MGGKNVRRVVGQIPGRTSDDSPEGRREGGIPLPMAGVPMAGQVQCNKGRVQVGFHTLLAQAMASSSGVKKYYSLPMLIYDVLKEGYPSQFYLEGIVERIDEKKHLILVCGKEVNMEQIRVSVAKMTNPNDQPSAWQGKVMRSFGPPPRTYWAVPADGATLPLLPPPTPPSRKTPPTPPSRKTPPTPPSRKRKTRNVPSLTAVQKAVPVTGYDYHLLFKSLLANEPEADVRAVWEALKPMSTDVGYFGLCDAHGLPSHWAHPRLFGLFGNCFSTTGKKTLKYLEITYKVEWKEWSEIAKGAAVELFWGAALGLVDIGVKGITPHFELGLCGNYRAKLNAFEGDGVYRSPENEKLRRAKRAKEAMEAKDLLDRNAWAGINVHCEFFRYPVFLERKNDEKPTDLIRRTSGDYLYGQDSEHKAKDVWERFKRPKNALPILTRKLTHPKRDDDSPYESMAWFTFRLVGDIPPPPPPPPVE